MRRAQLTTGVHSFHLVARWQPWYWGALQGLANRTLGRFIYISWCPEWLVSLSIWLDRVIPRGKVIEEERLTIVEAYGVARALGYDMESAWGKQVAKMARNYKNAKDYNASIAIYQVLKSYGFDHTGAIAEDAEYWKQYVGKPHHLDM